MFIVLEIQDDGNGTIGTIVNKKATRDEADSTYHTILAAASISNVPIHSAVMLTSDGGYVCHETHYHNAE